MQAPHRWLFPPQRGNPRGSSRLRSPAGGCGDRLRPGGHKPGRRKRPRPLPQSLLLGSRHPLPPKRGHHTPPDAGRQGPKESLVTLSLGPSLWQPRDPVLVTWSERWGSRGRQERSVSKGPDVPRRLGGSLPRANRRFLSRDLSEWGRRRRPPPAVRRQERIVPVRGPRTLGACSGDPACCSRSLQQKASRRANTPVYGRPVTSHGGLPSQTCKS